MARNCGASKNKLAALYLPLVSLFQTVYSPYRPLTPLEPLSQHYIKKNIRTYTSKPAAPERLLSQFTFSSFKGRRTTSPQRCLIKLRMCNRFSKKNTILLICDGYTMRWIIELLGRLQNVRKQCLGFDLNCANIEFSSSCMDGSPILCWFFDQGKGVAGFGPSGLRKQMSRRNRHRFQQRVWENVRQKRPCITVYFYELKRIFKRDLGCNSGQIEHTQIDSFDRAVRLCWLWHRVCVRICQRRSKRKTFWGTKTKKRNKMP